MSKNYTLKLLSNEWLEFHRSTIKYSTYEMYFCKIKKILEYFQDCDINSIDAFEVQKFLNELANIGFSKSNIKKYRVTLSQIFDYAIVCKLITDNPCQHTVLPRTKAAVPRRILTEEEIEVIIKSVSIPIPCNFEIYPFILLYTGMRRSELLALKWEDIDFDDNTIHICKVCSFQKNVPIVDYELKNGDDDRYVPMPIVLRNILYPFKNRIGYIFNENGNLLTKSLSDKYFNTYLQKNNLKFTQHMVRHTYATMLYNAEVDVKTAQKILGHKCISMTLDIYTHLEKKNFEKSAQKINNFISSIAK